MAIVWRAQPCQQSLIVSCVSFEGTALPAYFSLYMAIVSRAQPCQQIYYANGDSFKDTALPADLHCKWWWFEGTALPADLHCKWQKFHGHRRPRLRAPCWLFRVKDSSCCTKFVLPSLWYSGLCMIKEKISGKIVITHLVHWFRALIS